MPAAGDAVPPFTLADTDGKPRTLGALQREERKPGEPGRPLALFVFCGCSWCASVAREWAALQQGGALPEATRTVIVYQGDAAEVKGLRERAGLDPKTTLLLPDPKFAVSSDLLHADPCPRVFVLDGAGVVRFVNDRPENAPRNTPAAQIAAEAAVALQRASASSPAPRP